MAGLSPSDLDVDLDDHARFERRWRWVQAIVLGLIAISLAAGLLGFMGPGLLPRLHQPLRTAPFDVSYDRTLRYQAPAEIRIEGRSGAPGQDLQVHVDRELIDAGGLQQATPQPVSVSADGKGQLYRFAGTAGSAGTLVFKLRPSRAGILNGKLVVDGEPVTLRQFVWP
jgi:hypothetical protein